MFIDLHKSFSAKCRDGIKLADGHIHGKYFEPKIDTEPARAVSADPTNPKWKFVVSS